MKKLLISVLMMGTVFASQAQANTGLYPALALVAGIAGQGIFPTSDNYTTNDDIVIATTEGEQLAANIFVPTKVSGPMPAIIFINSWALNEYEYLPEAARFAEEGYVVLSYSTRGFGTSSGLINTAGNGDMADLNSVIDYLVANYNVDANRIGAAGISYGAGISLLAAAKVPRIKAVAALSGWGSLWEALYANDTPRLVWGELLTMTSGLLGNPDPIIKQQWQHVQAGTNMDQLRVWTDERSPIAHVDQINSNGTAVYMAQNYGDNLFQPNSVLDLYNRLQVPKHIDLQAGTHAFPEIIGMIGGGNTKVLNNMHRWFAKHLKGDTNAMNGQQPVQMKTKLSSNWEGFSQFPPREAKNQALYLHPRGLITDGKLETKPYSNRKVVETTIKSNLDTVASTQIPILAELLEQADVPVTAGMGFLLRNHSAAFETGRLSNGMKIRGIPNLKTTIQVNKNHVQLVAYLYEVNLFNVGTLITHAPISMRNATVGKNHEIDLDLVAVSYDVKPGNRLALVIDTQDLLYSKPASNFNVDFQFGGNLQSVLTVPAL